MYIFFQNNQYLGSYYLTGSDDDPVTKLQTNCQLTFALIETLQLRHYVRLSLFYCLQEKRLTFLLSPL